MNLSYKKQINGDLRPFVPKMTHDDLISMNKPKLHEFLTKRTAMIIERGSSKKNVLSPLKFDNQNKSLDSRFSKLNAKLVSVDVPGIQNKNINDMKTSEPLRNNSARTRAIRKA